MYLLILTILFFILVMFLEASHLKCEYIKLGESLNLRVALISDLHMGLLMVSENDVGKALDENHPDLLIIAGDLIDDKKHIQMFTDWMNKVAPKCPVFVTLGNHDHTCFIKNTVARDIFMFNLQSLGIELLINEAASFHKGGRIINLVGFDDYRHCNTDAREILSRLNPQADFTLAIAHNPETVLSIPEGSVDLVLCGHFHGGQIWMPFGIEYRLLRHEKTCRAGYRRGLHNINGTRTYISRGLGNVVVPLRLGSRPEITFIDL